jgi:hypothetical protein
MGMWAYDTYLLAVCNMYHNNRHNYKQLYCIYTLKTPIIMTPTCAHSPHASLVAPLGPAAICMYVYGIYGIKEKYGIKDTYVVCKCVKKTLLELGFNLPRLGCVCLRVPGLCQVQTQPPGRAHAPHIELAKNTSQRICKQG